MRPRAHLKTLALLFCATNGLFASGEQPDHLMPVPYETGITAKYRKLVYKHLLVTPAQFGRMIWEPGFSEPEWAVSVYGVGATHESTQPYHSYYVTFTGSLDSIWGALPQNGERHKQKPIRVTRKDTAITPALAFAVQAAWRAMLSRTRVEEERFRGFIFMDAPTAEFTLGSQRGEITPPRKGLTDEMYEIATTLATLCDVPAAQRSAKEKKLIRRLSTFERKAQKA